MNIRYLAGFLFLMLAGEQVVFCAEPLLNAKSQGELMPLSALSNVKENEELTAQLEDHVRNEVGIQLKSLPRLGTISLSKEQQDQIKRGLGFVGSTDNGKEVVVADRDSIANLGTVTALTAAVLVLGPLCYWMYKLRGVIARLQGRLPADIEMGEVPANR